MKITITSISIVFALLFSAYSADSIVIADLNAAIKLGLGSNIDIANAKLDVESKRQFKNEVLSEAYPQIRAGAKLLDNLIIPTTVYPASFLGGPPGKMMAFQIGTDYNAEGSIAARQILFDRSLLLRLKSAGMSEQLYGLMLLKGKESLAMQLASGYYSILLSERHIGFLKKQLESYHGLYKIAEIQFKNGVKKKSDMERILVNQTNVETELEKYNNSLTQQISDLKLLMGLKSDDRLVFTDSLTENPLFGKVKTARIASRPDRLIMRKQEDLKRLDIDRIKSGFLPTLALQGQFARDFYGNDLKLKPWYNSSYVALLLDFPVFDGMKRQAQILQGRIDLREIQNKRTLLELTIDKEIQDAENRLSLSVSRMQSQSKNRELASEVLRETSVEYKEGTASLSDLLNAENALLEAQRQYLSAFADKLVAELALEKAKGVFLSDFDIQ